MAADPVILEEAAQVADLQREAREEVFGQDAPQRLEGAGVVDAADLVGRAGTEDVAHHSHRHRR